MIREAIRSLALFSIGVSVALAGPADISTWLPQKCTPAGVIGALEFQSTDRAAATAKLITPILNKMSALASKAHNPNEPVGPQLSSADNEKFGELRQQLIALQTREYLESVYQKHLELIEDMAEAQDAYYRWGKTVDKSNSNLLADSVPALLEVADHNGSKVKTPLDHCSLGTALFLMEKPSLDKLNSPQTQAMIGTLRTLQAKYGGVKFEPSIMTPGDKKLYEQARKQLIEMRSDEGNIDMIEQIRSMARTADLIYRSDLNDVENSMGDPRSIGSTLRSLKDEGTLSKGQLLRIGLWAKLDDKYPCDDVRFAQMGADMMRKLNLTPASPVSGAPKAK